MTDLGFERDTAEIVFLDRECNILVLTNFKNFSLIHEKMKDIVKNIDFKVLQQTTWIDLHESKLSGKSIWNKIKEKHSQVLITFEMKIVESVDSGVVVYNALTVEPEATKILSSQEFQDEPQIKNIELWITGNVWEVKMAMA